MINDGPLTFFTYPLNIQLMQLFELFFQDPFHQQEYHLNYYYIMKQAIQDLVIDMV